MRDLAMVWWTWMASASLQLLVLLPIVWLVDRILARRGWPALQTALWVVVMVRVICPPSIATLVPPETVARLPDAAALMAMPSVPGAVVTPLFIVWLAGASFCGLWLLWRHTRLHGEWTRGGSEAPAEIVRGARDAANRVGLARLPRLVVHPTAPRPAALGIANPVVVLPGTLLRDIGSADLEHVLLHELVHVRRRDALRSGVCLALQVLYWFHPAVWLARARLATLREIACDAHVVSTAASRDAYRRTLIRLARPLASTPRIAGAGLGLFERRSDLLTRLSLLERPVASRPRVRRAAAALLFVTGVMSVVALDAAASTRLVPDDPLSSLDRQGCLRFRYAVFAALAHERDGSPETSR